MTKFLALLTAYNALKVAGNVLGAGHNLWFAVLSIPRKKRKKKSLSNIPTLIYSFSYVGVCDETFSVIAKY